MSIQSDNEGTLYKWTNYWGGWQPRWVILQNGILSYYNNSDEVGKGCRASIKITASDIVAYPNDNTRLDVVVPNEQRWYLKASNAAERQAWLIALGTSKANIGKEEIKKASISQESSHELRKSMNEVRLFCDLLVQQACKVKEESLKDKPDSAMLSDSCVLLSTTCDTFLATLGRCLEVSEETINPSIHTIQRSQSYGGQPALPHLNSSKSKHKKKHTKSIGRSPPTTPVFHGSDAKWNPDSPLHPAIDEAIPNTEMSLGTSANDASPEHPSTHIRLTSIDGKVNEKRPSETRNDRFAVRSKGVNASVGEESMLTLFSAMLHSFSDINLQEDGGIPTVPFLSACEGILPFLDTIGSTAFAPVRIDVVGNISKLKTKHSSDSIKFKILQNILNQEIKTSTTGVRNSATDALMWLKRGLRFMQKFLIIFKDGERDLVVALNRAYAATLKPYHGWVVKGIFALAVKAAPYSSDFVKALAINPDHAEDERFLTILLQDIEQYTLAMDVVLHILDNFYEQFHLESLTVV